MMKKGYYIYMLIGIFCWGACTTEDIETDVAPTDRKPIAVRLMLTMKEDTGGSDRALPTRGGQEAAEESLGNEYYINPYDVQLLVFQADTDRLVEKAAMVRASRVDAEGYRYELSGLLTQVAGDGNHRYRLVVLANMNGVCYCSNLPVTLTQGLSITDIPGALTYTDYQSTFTEALLAGQSSARIPMWGVTTATLTDGGVVAVDMLRAMAKVRVKLAGEAARNYRLKGVTLNRANAQGYVLPAWTDALTLEGGTARARAVRIPTGASTLTDLPFVADGNEGYVMYLPEYQNATAAQPMVMNVALENHAGQTISLPNAQLYFREYATGRPLDVIRNHYYVFSISRVVMHAETALNYDVWASGQDEIEVPAFE